MRIAISTPAGHVGRKVVAILQAHGGHELILLARDPAKVATEKARGAQVFQRIPRVQYDAELLAGAAVAEGRLHQRLIVAVGGLQKDEVFQHP